VDSTEGITFVTRTPGQDKCPLTLTLTLTNLSGADDRTVGPYYSDS